LVRRKENKNLMNKWDLRFLSLAEETATWSKDPSTKCGCVIVDPDTNRIAGVGFNGFPRGMCDHDELYADRDTKLSRVLHAEENAVLNSVGSIAGYTAYVTGPPCNHCALVLIQSGIERVVCRVPTEDYLSRWEKPMGQNTRHDYWLLR
jgi:dCMP deaminase